MNSETRDDLHHTAEGDSPGPEGEALAYDLGTVGAERSERHRWVPWPALLGVPSTWFVAFMVSYLWAEASCVDGTPTTLAGTNDIVLVVLGVHLVGFAVTLAASVLAYRVRRRRLDDRDVPYEDDPSDFALMAGVMGFVFLLSLALVAAPAIVLSPC